MKLFYGSIENGEVIINPEEQLHMLKVLRMRSGDEASVTNGLGSLAKGKLVLEGKKVSLAVSEIVTNLPDFHPKLHIAIAPTKNIDRIEFFVEKATEMGISEITFLLTANSERKLLNLEKIQKQALAASKQSLRTHFPKINGLARLSDFLQGINPGETFVAHCDSSFNRTDLRTIQTDNPVFLVGPEGDFSTNEITMLAEKGISAVSLGNQRLRTETAGIYLAAWNYSRM